MSIFIYSFTFFCRPYRCDGYNKGLSFYCSLLHVQFSFFKVSDTHSNNNRVQFYVYFYVEKNDVFLRAYKEIKVFRDFLTHIGITTKFTAKTHVRVLYNYRMYRLFFFK